MISQYASATKYGIHLSSMLLQNLLKSRSSDLSNRSGTRAWFVSSSMADILSVHRHSNFGTFKFINSFNPAVKTTNSSWKQRVLDVFLLVLCFGIHRRYGRRLRRARAETGITALTFHNFFPGSLQEWTGKNIMNAFDCY